MTYMLASDPGSIMHSEDIFLIQRHTLGCLVSTELKDSSIKSFTRCDMRVDR